jgi:hypothetical protein
VNQLTVEYIQGAELPDEGIEWRDRTNALIDFSSGFTFALKVGYAGSAALLTKTAGISGASTTPNITISWAVAGELNTLAVGQYEALLTATRSSDGKDRKMYFNLIISPAIS